MEDDRAITLSLSPANSWLRYHALLQIHIPIMDGMPYVSH